MFPSVGLCPNRMHEYQFELNHPIVQYYILILFSFLFSSYSLPLKFSPRTHREYHLQLTKARQIASFKYSAGFLSILATEKKRNLLFERRKRKINNNIKQPLYFSLHHSFSIQSHFRLFVTKVFFRILFCSFDRQPM